MYPIFPMIPIFILAGCDCALRLFAVGVGANVFFFLLLKVIEKRSSPLGKVEKR